MLLCPNCARRVLKKTEIVVNVFGEMAAWDPFVQLQAFLAG